MSKPKRRTMRRLKRTLGVTALILALLIALIPDVGEARNTSIGGYNLEIMDEDPTFATGWNRKEGTGKASDSSIDAPLYFDVTAFNGNGDPTFKSSDFRIWITRETPGADGDDIVDPWFRQYYYRYQVLIKQFNKAAYDAEDKARKDAETEDPIGHPYEAPNRDDYYETVDAKYNYSLRFKYSDFFDKATRYYPAVYYYDSDTLSNAGNPSYASVNYPSNYCNPSGLEMSGFQTGDKSLEFTANFSNVGAYCQIYAFFNTEMHPELYLDLGDIHALSGGDPMNQVYLDGELDSITNEEYFTMPSDETIMLNDGVGSFVPGQKVYLDTTDIQDGGGNPETDPAVLGISGLVGNAEVVDAFYVKVRNDGLGETTDNLSANVISKMHNYTLHFTLPMAGDYTSRPYSQFRINNDQLQLLYYEDGSWHEGIAATSSPINDGTYMYLNFNYRPTMSRIAIVIQRATAVIVDDVRSTSMGYQKIAEQYNADDILDPIDRSWYVKIADHAGGDLYNTKIQATAGQDAYFTDDLFNNYTEILQIHTNENPDRTDLTDGSGFPAYTVKVGLKDTWVDGSDSRKIFLFHKVSGTTETPDKPEYWEKSELDMEWTGGTKYVTITVDEAYGTDYVLYYRSPKDESGEINEAKDLRNKEYPEGESGFANNGFEAFKTAGRMSGGTYTLVVKNKLNDFWISNTVSSYQTEIWHYDIYLAKAPKYNMDVSYDVSFSDDAQVTVHLPLPKTWKISNDTVQLFRAHKATPGSDPVVSMVSYSLESESNNIIKFTTNEFSEYAVFYRKLEEGDPTGSSLIVDDSDCFIADEPIEASAVTEEELSPAIKWKLVLTDPGHDTLRKERVKLLKSDAEKTIGEIDTGYYHPFYTELLESADGGNYWYDVTDIGDNKIMLTVPIPESYGYSGSGSLSVWGYNVDKTRGTQIKGVGISKDNKYITFPIDNSALQSVNPYMIVYKSSGGGGGGGGGGSEDPDSPAEAIEIDTYDPTNEKEMEVLPSGTTTVVDLSALGKDKWSVKTTIPLEDNMELKLLVSQYSDSNNTQIGQSIINNNGITAWQNGKSTIKAYDIKLKKTTNVGKSSEKVEWPSTPEDLGKKKVTITLPYQANLSDPNGTISVWSLDKSGSLENLLAATSATAGGTVTFTTGHFSQFALLYNPGTASPSGGASTVSSGGGGSTSTGSASSNASKSGTSNAGSSNSSSGASNSSSARSGSTSNTGGGSGGGGNRAGGDGKVDMPRTADATTYKAIFILILLAFGAFELVSSMPAKKKAKIQQAEQPQPQPAPRNRGTGTRRR